MTRRNEINQKAGVKNRTERLLGISFAAGCLALGLCMILRPIFTPEDAEHAHKIAAKIFVWALRWPGGIAVILLGMFTGASALRSSNAGQHAQDDHERRSGPPSPSISSPAPVRGCLWRITRFALTALAVTFLGGLGLYYLFTEKCLRLALECQRRMAGFTRREINLPGGLHYSYLEGGGGEPLMLLHGFGANKDSFLAVAKSLTPHFRVIIPDHIGFGESSHPPEADYSPPAQARRLRELAHALGAGRLHLGGNSMGGQIAMTYAALYPDDVASLWLLNPAGAWSAPASELQRIISETGRNPLMVASEAEFERAIAFVTNRPPHIANPISRMLARERIGNFKLEGRIFAQLLAYSVEEAIAGLKTPTLIAWGEQDRTLHAATPGILHKLMPQSQVIMMPGVGHLPMIEQPLQSVHDYLRFHASLRPR